MTTTRSLETSAQTWTSERVRSELLTGLRWELIGPDVRDPEEWQLEQLQRYEPPTKRYLAGFLVPADTPPRREDNPDAEDEELVGLEGQPDEDEPVADKNPRQSALPSSMGLSVLVPQAAQELTVVLHWGSYGLRPVEGKTDSEGRTIENWFRTPRSATVVLALTGHGTSAKVEHSGLEVRATVRPVHQWRKLGYPRGTRAVTVFVTNWFGPDWTASAALDRHTVFQVSATLQLADPLSFVARTDPRTQSRDPDEALADLHYRDVVEFAVGHGVAAEAEVEWQVAPSGRRQPRCQVVRTTWLPQQRVARVEPGDLQGEGPAVVLEMDALGALPDAAAVQAALGGLCSRYGAWIARQRLDATSAELGNEQRAALATTLLQDCTQAAARMQAGLALLASDDQARQAFVWANQAMASARRQRDVAEGRKNGAMPAWRPFQLAFVLMNLPGIADPHHEDRELVDLLFFPTGGGKTEAYLGLAAFAILLRRLRDPNWTSCGVTVLMRYTLRLLTLDQLGRAAQLVCALEQMRWQHTRALGEWPFEIGLWVGSATTPNQLGSQSDPSEHKAFRRIQTWKREWNKEPCPIPVETCPWCGSKLTDQSYQWAPSAVAPTHLAICCVNTDCAFSGDQPLPIVAVDETIYRRLPCFVIGTADKIASLPWRAGVGKLFGHVLGVQRSSAETPRGKEASFVGYGEPDRRIEEKGELAGPALIIQDELHLMSGPLGTMAGLYEVAVEALAERTGEGGRPVRPKLIASTATIRRAEQQVRCLFGRSRVAVFPPPGPHRQDSFFAREVAEDAAEHGGRLYVGVAAPGKSSKVLLMRSYQALLSRGWWAWKQAAKQPGRNPADPYVTLLGYFSSLKELGASRRIVEDEVASNLHKAWQRKPQNVSESPFASRDLREPAELTSRKDAGEIAKAKELLAQPRAEHPAQGCDVALATNMISVGLDILRLGLMVVLHQPKSTAEYIQATSRVGRDAVRPGLVVTLLNLQRTRDRSHFERFGHFHQQFYRQVESTSVTPFSPRALDRGLAAVVVGLARHLYKRLTAPENAVYEPELRQQLRSLADRLAERARATSSGEDAELLADAVSARVTWLLDRWRDRVPEQGGFPYDGVESGGGERRVNQLLYPPLAPELRDTAWGDPRLPFVAPWSLRNVEHTAGLFVQMDGSTTEV